MSTTRLESINEAYTSRVGNLAGADDGKTAEAEKARKDSGIVSVEAPLPADDDEVTTTEDDESPDMSWKKDAIIDYIVALDEDVTHEELEMMTKAELLERFTDYEG